MCARSKWTLARATEVPPLLKGKARSDLGRLCRGAMIRRHAPRCADAGSLSARIPLSHCPDITTTAGLAPALSALVHEVCRLGQCMPATGMDLPTLLPTDGQ